jgi:peptidylprolyl isomerase
VVVEDPPRQSRSLERPKGPRPPRERTPVVEREPVRRRSRTVEIHQTPEQARGRTESAGRRQVRFAENIDYEEYGTRPRRCNEYQLSESDDNFRDEIRRRIFERRVPRNIDGRPRYRRIPPESSSYQTTDLPRATIRPSRLRPRIIQDGNREILEAGDRIYAEARRRRYEDRDLPDLVSHSTARWRRRFDDTRDFSSDDDSYIRSAGSWRYGRRWL